MNFLSNELNQGHFLGLAFLLSAIHLYFSDKKNFNNNSSIFLITIILGLIFGSFFYSILFGTDYSISSNSIAGSYIGITFTWVFLRNRLEKYKEGLGYSVHSILILSIIGKIGCFFGNCCTGESPILDISLQFAESFLYLMIFFALYIFPKNKFKLYINLVVVLRLSSIFFRDEYYTSILGINFTAFLLISSLLLFNYYESFNLKS